MRTLIITVGTSLLTNDGWRRNQSLPALSTLLSKLGQADPITTSAETNTLFRLGLRETDRLAWLYSATEEGRLCAQALREHYAASGYTCSLHEIGGLGYQAESFAERGLRSLLDLTFNLIRSAGGPDYVAICATGGFKAQLAYLNLVGLLMGIEVYYLHEDFSTLIKLPRLPLNWDTSWVERHVAFFEWIDGEPRTSAQVEGWLKAAPELRALVTEDETGHSYLSASGDLLFRAYRERAATGPRATWPRASVHSQAEKDRLSSEGHHRIREWEHIVRQLTEIDCVESVRFDGNGKGQGGNRPRVYSADAASGSLGLVFGQGQKELPLLVETTARDEAQLELLRGHIEQKILKR